MTPALSLRTRWMAATLLLLAFFLAFYRTAWVAEDAFITFRVIDNWIAGHGLRWNIDERVQVFTHPLWMFLLSPLVWLSSDPYWSSIGLSAALMLVFCLLCLKAMGGPHLRSLLALSTLLWCQAFVDYSSSGLENPLTHVLLVLFFIAWKTEHPHRVLRLSALSALLFLNRPDAVVLVAPALVASLAASRDKPAVLVRQFLPGLLPAVLWTLFSLFYFGSPVPNTAIAKVLNGLTAAQSAQQAWNLVVHAYEYDLPTLVTILAGLGFGLTRAALRPIAAGIALWFGYLVYVGGDYMAGRFLAGPLVFSILVLGTVGLSSLYTVTWALLLVASTGALHATVLSPISYQQRFVMPSGIANERGFYYQELGMRRVLEHHSWKLHPWFVEGDKLRKQPPAVYAKCNIGMTAFAAGSQATWIDPLALAEPFLARLPARSNSRVGHYERAFPEGFLTARATGSNTLAEPALQRLWTDIRLATSANLFSLERLASIKRLNLDKKLYVPEHFDRDAVGIPGHPVTSRSQTSCMGYPGEVQFTLRLQ